jgi:hypothetical protein
MAPTAFTPYVFVVEIPLDPKVDAEKSQVFGN